MSKEEYINWLDDDDVMMEDFILLKVNVIPPKWNLVICSGYYVDEILNNKIKMVMETDRKFNLFKDFLFWKLQIITNCVLFRKSFLIGKELFLYRIKRGQETELFSRLFFKLPVVRYKIINNPSFLYRQHYETKTAKNPIYK